MRTLLAHAANAWFGDALREARDQRDTLGYYVVLGLLLSAIGFGESYGYVAGEGNAIDYLNDFEFRRDRFLVAADRKTFLSGRI